jgi:hypothetical protein
MAMADGFTGRRHVGWLVEAAEAMALAVRSMGDVVIEATGAVEAVKAKRRGGCDGGDGGGSLQAPIQLWLFAFVGVLEARAAR